MKKVISTGYILVDIIEDEFEGNKYNALEVKISKKTTERVKLKAPSSYELLEIAFEQQAKNNK